jgi:hypothetical protein
VPAAKKAARQNRATKELDGGFINMPVSKQTRAGLHLLKEAMGVRSQAEVVEKLVAIGLAIHLATR